MFRCGSWGRPESVCGTPESRWHWQCFCLKIKKVKFEIWKRVELTFISMTLSKRTCGASWNSNRKFWQERGGTFEYIHYLTQTPVFEPKLLNLLGVFYLTVIRTVCWLLCHCVSFLISHPDKNCRVDVHTSKLLRLQDVYVYLNTHKNTHISGLSCLWQKKKIRMLLLNTNTQKIYLIPNNRFSVCVSVQQHQM